MDQTLEVMSLKDCKKRMNSALFRRDLYVYDGNVELAGYWGNEFDFWKLAVEKKEKELPDGRL